MSIVMMFSNFNYSFSSIFGKDSSYIIPTTKWGYCASSAGENTGTVRSTYCLKTERSKTAAVKDQCKRMCDEDINCKGYDIHKEEKMCRYYTTSDCDKPFQFEVDNFSPISKNDGFTGCFVKKRGIL